MKYKLSVSGVSYDLDGRAFRIKDLDVDFSRMLVIKGHVGSGKTILLKTLAGVISPDKGTVALRQGDVTPSCCFVHSQPEFNFVTGIVGDELDFACIKDKMPFTGFLKRNVNEISGGELKRLSVMMALDMAYDVLLLDEPLDMMDDIQSEHMAAYIAGGSDKKPLIIATHDDHFDKYADLIVRIDDTAQPEPAPVDALCSGKGEVVFRSSALSIRTREKAFPEISLECTGGEVVCLFGMNGAGKTLFIRAVSGIGRLEYEGGWSWFIDKPHRGVCLQFPEQMAYQERIEEEIADTAGPHNVEMVLDVLGWRDRRGDSPFVLSDGEKRTLYLVSNLLSKGCCIFDEPFAGLDQGSINLIARKFAEAKMNGKTVIYTANRIKDTIYADRTVRIGVSCSIPD